MQKASAISRKKASRREPSKLSVLSCLENLKLMKFHRAPRNLRSLVAFLAFLVPAWSQLATISAGSTHSCAVYGDGTLECWGDNGRGQLGQGYTSTRENSRKSVDLPSDFQGGTWNDVQCGTSFTCAILLNEWFKPSNILLGRQHVWAARRRGQRRQIESNVA